MNTSTRFTAVVMVVLGLLGLGCGSASAEAGNGGSVPLGENYRSCDYTKLASVAGPGFGSGTSTIRSDGATVTADVFLMVGRPNTPYQVRLIQGPRPGAQRCNAGDPGVAGGVADTQGHGGGAGGGRGAAP